MSQMKRYFEELIDELDDEELMEMGYSEEDIDEIRGNIDYETQGV